MKNVNTVRIKKYTLHRNADLGAEFRLVSL